MPNIADLQFRINLDLNDEAKAGSWDLVEVITFLWDEVHRYRRVLIQLGWVPEDITEEERTITNELLD